MGNLEATEAGRRAEPFAGEEAATAVNAGEAGINAVQRRRRIVGQIRVIRRGRGGGLLPLPFAGSVLPERGNALRPHAGTK